MDFFVKDETSKLKSVIIGIANSSGGIPELNDLYDPKSIKNLIAEQKTNHKWVSSLSYF